MLVLRGLLAGFVVLTLAIVVPPATHAAEPGISVNPASYDFGTWTAPNDVVPVRGFNVISSGTDDLVVEDAAITGPGAASFWVSEVPETCALVPPGSNCMINVSFSYHDVAPGPKNANLAIASNATAEPLLVPLTGHVHRATVSFSPRRHDFGSVVAGSGEKTSKAFSITSTGSIPFTLPKPAISVDRIFSPPVLLTEPFELVSEDCAGTISPGQTCSATVTFDPDRGTVGPQSAFITFGHGLSPGSAELVGDALPPPPVGPDLNLELRFRGKPTPGRTGILAIRLRNDGPEATYDMSVAIEVPRRAVKTRRTVRFAKIGGGETSVEKIRIKVRRSARKGRAIRIAGTVRIAGTTITKAQRTIRVR